MPETAQTTFRTYKGLVVYQKAKNNTVTLFRYYKSQKLLWAERFVIEQLLRATASIGANIAEGYGRQHKNDYRRFIGIARGSALETEHWINLLLEIRPQEKRVLEEILASNVEIIKILTTFMKNLHS